MTKGFMCFVLRCIAQVTNAQYFLVTVNGSLQTLIKSLMARLPGVNTSRFEFFGPQLHVQNTNFKINFLHKKLVLELIVNFNKRRT